MSSGKRRWVKTGLLLAGMLTGSHLQAQPAAGLRESLHEGDIIFQESVSDFSTAIQLATHSRYSHCGLLFKKEGQWYVYEAIEPVGAAPLQEWIARGRKQHYVVKRLKGADSLLTPPVLEKLLSAGKQYAGRHYDFYFGWSDERIYCSELVWKMYKEATGLELGTLQQFRDFDLTHPAVKKQMKSIYGNHIPLEEKIISPVSMFNSPLLVKVSSN
ncbi:YiiX family permuted papain-like enzyme [Chitinophaga solisilvae]|uniref:YiiX family permuted papain-like enzyme n=1 Tax=Chitinophaga solisilvae TaxID=1233460 RepID=UPI00136A43A4|nr:YiiX family permuted papain-like enzyme [Chitinophaga solisilvae]